MNYEELCDCENCPLNGTTKVGGEGSRTEEVDDGVVVIGPMTKKKRKIVRDNEGQYEVVAVGIHPAFEELKSGRPFVGMGGQILREVLGKLGLSDYYLTNTMMCCPPDDLASKDKSRMIKEAVDCCSERMLQEVRDRNPKLVIALGNIALHELTGDKRLKITEMQGRVLKARIGRILPAVHPANIPRQIDSFPDFRDAIKAGRDFLDGKYFFPSIPETVVVNDENFSEILQRIDNAELVAVDLETTRNGFFPYGLEPDGIRCIAIAIDDKTAYIVPGESSQYYESHPDFSKDPRLIKILNSKKLILHNAPFDMGFLWQAGYRTKIYYDTLLAHYHQNDERNMGNGLKDCAKKYLGAPDWEADIKSYLPYKKSSYDYIPDDVLYKYASSDVVYTFQLYQYLTQFLHPSDKLFSDLIMPCSNMFVDIRHRGLEMDVTKILRLNETLEEDLATSVQELRDMVGWINPFSPADVCELLYDKMNLPVLKRFGRSSNKKFLALHQPNPIIDKIIEIRQLGKLNSTYVISLAKFLDKQCKVHPLFKQFSTVTGRISAEDPSVLNIRRDSRVKEMYLPTNAKNFLESDQKQIELRVYAVMAQDDELKKIFADPDKDPHGIMNTMLNEVTGKVWPRTVAKGGVFGVLYGRGEESLSIGFNTSREDAREIKATIKSMFPKLPKFQDYIKEMVHGQGYVETYFGRKRRFPLITYANKEEIYRQALNMPIQGTASDINLFCMLHAYQNEDRWGYHPMFPVHDAIDSGLEDFQMLPKVKKELEELSGDLLGNQIGFVLDCKAGPNWGSTKPLAFRKCSYCSSQVLKDTSESKDEEIWKCVECGKVN